MPSKKVQIPKTPVKPDDDVDPATIAKNNENKESARKLISDLKVKIPRVHSPIKREELSDIFCDIKCNCELGEAGTTDQLNKLIAATDAEILEPSKPEKDKEESTTTESDKASDLGMDDSDLSYCTLEELCKPSEDDKRPHVITSRNGGNMAVDQDEVDKAAADNTVNYSNLLKAAHKFINDNCFDSTAAFEPQFESFLSAFLCHRVTTVGKTLPAGYRGYTSQALMELSLNGSKHLLLTRAQYTDITRAISASLDVYVKKKNVSNEVSRRFAKIDSTVPPSGATCLELKLQDLRNLSNQIGTTLSDEEKMGRFYANHFREVRLIDNKGERKTLVKQVFETACHYLNSLIDAQTEANSGCRHEQQLISDSDIVSTFRQQITGSGISPSSTDTYDRILYDTLLRPIASNRREPGTHLETKNITELSGLCVHTLSAARAAHWHPPNTETKEDRDRNRSRPAQRDTASPNPQQGNYSYHRPAQSGSAPSGGYNAPAAQHGNFASPATGNAPQRFIHPSFSGGGGPIPAPPKPNGFNNRVPNPDGTLNCFSCGKTHKNLTDCPFHFTKVGQSPFRGATDSQGRLLCLGCGSAHHRMSKCDTGPAPPGTPTGTVGFTYHGLPGPAYRNFGNLAMPPPPPTDPDSVHSGRDSQHTQSGCLASQLLDSASTSPYSFGAFGDAQLETPAS